MMLEPDRADCLMLSASGSPTTGCATRGSCYSTAPELAAPEIKAQRVGGALSTARHEVPSSRVVERDGMAAAEPPERRLSRSPPTRRPSRPIQVSWPYNNVGRLYVSQNDDAQALTWFTKALEVNPHHLARQFNQARRGAARTLRRSVRPPTTAC